MLKKVCFYIEYLSVHELAAGVFMDLWLHKIQAERLPVEEALRRARAGKEESRPCQEESRLGVMEHEGEEADSASEETLIVTDLPGIAEYYWKRGYAVLGYLHEKNRGASFPGVSYLTEDFSGISAEYCRMVYNRAHGIPQQILETERCIVREMMESDVDRLYEIYADPEITAYMEPLYEDRQEELAYIGSYIRQVYGFYGYGMWVIVEKESGCLIGRAGIEQKEEWPELGYVIAAKWQHRGYAFEVCRAILAYAREELFLSKIRARIHRDNFRSAGLCRKLGFIRTGSCGVYELFSYEGHIHGKTGSEEELPEERK